MRVRSDSDTRPHTRRAVVTDLEFVFRTAVVLLPLFSYLNGPSVSDDQWWTSCMTEVFETALPLKNSDEHGN